ncbi:gp53-like domain-containing protein [Treponema pectinovorum]
MQWGTALSCSNSSVKRSFSIPFASIPIVVITPEFDRRGSRASMYNISKSDFSFAVFTAEDTYLNDKKSFYIAIGK